MSHHLIVQMNVAHYESQFKLFLFIIQICEKIEDVSTSRIWNENRMAWSHWLFDVKWPKRTRKEKEICYLLNRVFSDWMDMILFPMISTSNIDVLSTIHYWVIHTWLSISCWNKTNNWDFPIKESRIWFLICFCLIRAFCMLILISSIFCFSNSNNEFALWISEQLTDNWRKIICHLKCNAGRCH